MVSRQALNVEILQFLGGWARNASFASIEPPVSPKNCSPEKLLSRKTALPEKLLSRKTTSRKTALPKNCSPEKLLSRKTGGSLWLDRQPPSFFCCENSTACRSTKQTIPSLEVVRMTKTPLHISLLLFVLIASVPPLRADERRAPAPKFSPNQTRGIFFDDLNQAFRGARPTLSSVRKSSDAAATAATAANTPTVEDGGDDAWSPLVSPTSLEDEIKRMRLHYDAVVTTPGNSMAVATRKHAST